MCVSAENRFGPFLTRVFTREPRPIWAGLRRDAGPVSPSGTNNFVWSLDFFFFLVFHDDEKMMFSSNRRETTGTINSVNKSFVE